MTDVNAWKREYREAHLSGDLDRARKALDVKETHLPAKLYRYRSFDEDGYSLKAIESNTIWLGRAADFNDPFDCSLTLDLAVLEEQLFHKAIARVPIFQDLPDAARRSIMESRSFEELSERLVDLIPDLDPTARADRRAALSKVAGERSAVPLLAVQKYVQQGTKVACFTTKYDSMPMWAHYASDHSGFCVEYDVKDFDDSRRRNIHPVVYSDERFDFTRWLEPERDRRFIAIVAATHKSDQWAYEDEWRLVIPDGEPTPGQLWDMPQPTALYISYKIKDGDKSKLLRVADKSRIPAYEMRLHPARYALEPKSI